MLEPDLDHFLLDTLEAPDRQGSGLPATGRSVSGQQALLQVSLDLTRLLAQLLCRFGGGEDVIGRNDHAVSPPPEVTLGLYTLRS